MSLKYIVLKKLFSIIGIKRSFQKSPEQLVEEARKQKIKIPKLHHKDIDVSIREIAGCTVLHFKHKQTTDQLVYMIIGGGMLKYPQPMAIKKSLKLCIETHKDFMIPFYPLCVDHGVNYPIEKVYEIYKAILQEYSAQNITLCGSSSGGYLGLSLVSYINTLKEVEVFPRMFLSSPGGCFHTLKQQEMGKKLNTTDFLIDYQFMKNIEVVMKNGKEDLPDYIFDHSKGNYSNLKEVYLCYGDEEVLYAMCDEIKESLERDHVKVTLEIGKGLFHVYSFYPLVKESKQGWVNMSNFLKGEK